MSDQRSKRGLSLDGRHAGKLERSIQGVQSTYKRDRRPRQTIKSKTTHLLTERITSDSEIAESFINWNSKSTTELIHDDPPDRTFNSQYVCCHKEFLESALANGLQVPHGLMIDSADVVSAKPCKFINFVDRSGPSFILLLFSTDLQSSQLVKVSLLLLTVIAQKLKQLRDDDSANEAIVKWASIHLQKLVEAGFVPVCINVLMSTPVEDIQKMSLTILILLVTVSDKAAMQMLDAPTHTLTALCKERFQKRLNADDQGPSPLHFSVREVLVPDADKDSCLSFVFAVCAYFHCRPALIGAAADLVTAMIANTSPTAIESVATRVARTSWRFKITLESQLQKFCMIPGHLDSHAVYVESWAALSLLTQSLRLALKYCVPLGALPSAHPPPAPSPGWQLPALVPDKERENDPLVLLSRAVVGKGRPFNESMMAMAEKVLHALTVMVTSSAAVAARMATSSESMEVILRSADVFCSGESTPKGALIASVRSCMDALTAAASASAPSKPLLPDPKVKSKPRAKVKGDRDMFQDLSKARALAQATRRNGEADGTIVDPFGSPSGGNILGEEKRPSARTTQNRTSPKPRDVSGSVDETMQALQSSSTAQKKKKSSLRGDTAGLSQQSTSASSMLLQGPDTALVNEVAQLKHLLEAERLKCAELETARTNEVNLLNDKYSSLLLATVAMQTKATHSKVDVFVAGNEDERGKEELRDEVKRLSTAMATLKEELTREAITRSASEADNESLLSLVSDLKRLLAESKSKSQPDYRDIATNVPSSTLLSEKDETLELDSCFQVVVRAEVLLQHCSFSVLAKHLASAKTALTSLAPNASTRFKRYLRYFDVRMKLVEGLMSLELDRFDDCIDSLTSVISSSASALEALETSGAASSLRAQIQFLQVKARAAIGDCHHRQGNYGEAKTIYMEVLETVEAFLSPRKEISSHSIPSALPEFHVQVLIRSASLSLDLVDFRRCDDLLVKAAAALARLPDHSADEERALLAEAQARWFEARASFKEASSLMSHSSMLWERLFGSWHLRVANNWHATACLKLAVAKPIEAEKLLRDALSMKLGALPSAHSSVAATQHVMGMCALAEGHYLNAHQWLTTALETRRKCLGGNHLLIAESLLSLGECCISMGRDSEAKQHFDDSLQMRGSVLGSDNNYLIAEAMCGVARSAEARDLFFDATGWYERSLELLREQLPLLKVESLLLVEKCKIGLGRVLGNVGRTAQGQEFISNAGKSLCVMVGSKNPLVAEGLSAMGELFINLGKYSLAKRFLAQASDIMRTFSTSTEAQHPLLGHILNIAAENMRRCGDFQSAAEFNKEALGILTAALPKEHKHVLTCLLRRAQILKDIKCFDASEALHNQILTALTTLSEDESALFAMTLQSLGDLSRILGTPDSAKSMLKQALTLQLKIFGDKHVSVIETNLCLAMAMMDTEKLEELREARSFIIDEVLPLCEDILPSNHPLNMFAQGNLGLVYCSISEAEKTFRDGEDGGLLHSDDEKGRLENSDKNLDMRIYQVVFATPPKMMMSLRANTTVVPSESTRGFALAVYGFDRHPDGSLATAELDGNIQVNDLVMAVNGVSLKGLSCEDSLKLVAEAAWPRTIQFIRQPPSLATLNNGGVSASSLLERDDVMEEGQQMIDNALDFFESYGAECFGDDHPWLERLCRNMSLRNSARSKSTCDSATLEELLSRYPLNTLDGD